MDGNVGQAAGAEGKMLIKPAPDSAIILTKLDLGSLGAGAIAALAASNLPISFVACGEVIERHNSKHRSRSRHLSCRTIFPPALILEWTMD